MAIGRSRIFEVRIIRRFDFDLWHNLELAPYIRIRVGRAKPRIIPQLGMPQKLRRHFNKGGQHLHQTALLGAGCDPYPDAERSHRLSRLTLEILAEHNCTAHIVTGHSLVLRDLDLICELKELAGVNVSIVMPGLYKKTLKSIQPGYPPPDERIEVLKRIKRAGIQSGVVFNVLHPLINDNPRELERLFILARDLNIDYILFPQYIFVKTAHSFGENGSNIQSHSPNITHGSLSKDSFQNYIKYMRGVIFRFSEKYGIKLRIKRFLPHNYRRENCWLAQQLADSAYLRRMTGLPYQQLLRVAHRIENLDADIRNMIAEHEFDNFLTTCGKVRAEIEALTSGRWSDKMLISDRI